MHKVSYFLAERFSQDPLETSFCKQHPLGASKDKLPPNDFDFTNTSIPKSIQAYNNR